MVMENVSTTSEAAIHDGLSRSGLRENLLLRWARRLRKGRLTLRLPSGRELIFGGSSRDGHATLDVHDPALATRLITAGDIGLAESYAAGEWDTPDLTALLSLGIANEEALSGTLAVSWPVRAINRLRHLRRANTRRGSRRNIAAHYDLGNGFYRLWLDETMSYSSGLFLDLDEDLAQSQRRKYRRLARKLGLKPGDRVLEIGCGWGGFAEIAAAEFGCSVVGLTLSSEQAAHTRARMTGVGLNHLVEVRLQDYRDVEGGFDHIVSIEMFEAVGEENWPAYFGVLDRCLKPGGKAALQVITIADHRFGSYRRSPDFIQKHIFPGGLLPSPMAFGNAVSDAGLAVTDQFFFGRSYAETLRRWDLAFLDNWPKIAPQGFDERFRRLWHYYLCYCEAGFDTGQLDVAQFIVERP